MALPLRGGSARRRRLPHHLSCLRVSGGRAGDCIGVCHRTRNTQERQRRVCDALPRLAPALRALHGHPGLDDDSQLLLGGGRLDSRIPLPVGGRTVLHRAGRSLCRPVRRIHLLVVASGNVGRAVPAAQLSGASPWHRERHRENLQHPHAGAVRDSGCAVHQLPHAHGSQTGPEVPVQARLLVRDAIGGDRRHGPGILLSRSALPA